MLRLCPLTGMQIATGARGRPAEYASPEAKDLWFRWQAFMRLADRLTFTPAAARRMQGMFVMLVRGVRASTVQGDEAPLTIERMTDPPAPEYLADVDHWLGVTADEESALRLLAVIIAVFGSVDRAPVVRLARCVVTGAIIYAGTRNPRRFVSEDAADFDLRLQQVRTLLRDVLFTPKAARAFKGELFSLSQVFRKRVDA